MWPPQRTFAVQRAAGFKQGGADGEQFSQLAWWHMESSKRSDVQSAEAYGMCVWRTQRYLAA